MTVWERVNKFDKRTAALADRHYSRRKVGSPQFMPPGQTIILWHPDGAVFGWWRPHPSSGIKQMNGLDGWTCTIFRNESPHRSSDLILMAEMALDGETCGPDGMLTYVWDKKIASENPGYCFKKAGWVTKGRSADGRKTLLWKPFEQRGVSECMNYQNTKIADGIRLVAATVSVLDVSKSETPSGGHGLSEQLMLPMNEIEHECRGCPDCKGIIWRGVGD